MKKLLLGLGICLILGITLCFTARNWVRIQTLRAIESATGSKVQTQAFTLELLAGRVNLHEVILIPKKQSTPIEKISVLNASGKIRWSEWSSGIIPMEAMLENCSVTLRQGDRVRFLKEHIRLPRQPMPSISTAPDHPSKTHKSRIILTALKAKNVTILSGTDQTALVGGVNCSARRGMTGWQGELTAESIGMEAIPLTKVKIGFSSEAKGTRVAEFRCNLKNGTISGNGWCSDDGATALDLQVDSLQLASIAPAWFGNAISGTVSGSFTFSGDPVHWQHGTVVGSFALKEGAMKLGAASQMLSLLGGTNTNGVIQLDAASATLTLTPEQWTLSQIRMNKAGLFEMEGNLSCNQDAKIKADLNLGISSQFPLAPGQFPSTGAQGEKLTWTPVHFETTPDQLWQGILTSLLTPTTSGAAQSANPKPALQQKAKAAVDSVINLLSR